MDSHVKERIVGAAVLVALGVWLIPWVLDGPEPEPEPSPVPGLQLPTPDTASPIRTETVELSARPVTSPLAGGDAAQELPASAPPPTVASAPPPVVRAASGATSAPADQAAAAAPPAVPTSATGGGLAAWSVQVGAFSDRANADQLAGRVTDFGHAAAVSEFRSNGQPMYRVRVEGFATRERAEAASSSLSAHGIPARVVAAE